MKYSRIYKNSGNINDFIQNIAVENLYKEFGANEVTEIEYNMISNYTDDKSILFMQGEFTDINISKNLYPLYVDFRLNNSSNEDFYKKMEPFEPIGCGDIKTFRFLKKLGLKTYLSGSVVLTLPKRAIYPSQEKIFIVDVTPESEKIIPQNIKNVADRSISHYYDAPDAEFRAKEILNQYEREAKLVITSNPYSALICVAMNIPVVYINENSDSDGFEILTGIIPKYNPRLKWIINWTPKPVDVEEFKSLIKKNIFIRLDLSGKNEKVIMRKLKKRIDKYRKYCFISLFFSSFYYYIKRMMPNKKI